MFPIFDVPFKSSGIYPISKYVTEPYLNIQKIYPLNQCAVEAIVKYVKEHHNASQVIIFGSSVRDDCMITSDVDFAVRDSDYRSWNKLRLPHGKSYDIIYLEELKEGSRLLENIRREGVVVYEH